MEINQIFAYILAVFVGVTLGLLGSGGSILSVPILVYVLKIEPVVATGYSLFIVGLTALVGGFQKAKQQLVDFEKVLLFGLPTLSAVFFTRKIIVPNIPETIYFFNGFSIKKSIFIMLIFAVVMIIAAIRMIKPMEMTKENIELKLNYFKIIFSGLFIGFIAGFVGAGGGFLIIPALVFLTKTPMKLAVGTSLFIIACQSLIGFLGDVQIYNTDWKLLVSFTTCSVFGILIGNYLSKKIAADKLKTGFGYFVLIMGFYIILKETLL
jgi:uncharacterized membrane protein YfcA